MLNRRHCCTRGHAWDTTLAAPSPLRAGPGHLLRPILRRAIGVGLAQSARLLSAADRPLDRQRPAAPDPLPPDPMPPCALLLRCNDRCNWPTLAGTERRGGPTRSVETHLHANICLHSHMLLAFPYIVCLSIRRQGTPSSSLQEHARRSDNASYVWESANDRDQQPSISRP